MKVCLAALCLALGCGADTDRIEIVLDLPAPSAASYPFGAGGVDTLRLAIARAGDEADLQTATASVDESLALSSIPFGRDLVFHLFGEQDGVEVAYGRSCSFDYELDGDSPGAVHVYFSRIVRWGDGPISTVSERVGAHAFARDNGSVIIAGGEGTAELELFNPRTGLWQALDEARDTTGRRGSTLAAIGGDRAVIVGGVDGANSPVSSIELLPDLRDSLDIGLSLREHDSAALVAGDALVAGGELWNGEAFEVSASAWEVGTGDGGAVREPSEVGSLTTARAQHTMTRLSDEVGAAVLVAGGVDSAGMAVSSAEVYRPLARVFEPVVGTIARWDHSAIRLPGGAVLIIGGLQPSVVDGTPEPARELTLFDPIGGAFTVAGEMPDAAPVTDFALTTLPDGRVLMTGGRDAAGTPTAAAFVVRFDVINGLVDMSLTDSLAMARANHAATIVCDGTVLVVGGEMAAAGDSTERYNPSIASRR